MKNTKELSFEEECLIFVKHNPISKENPLDYIDLSTQVLDSADWIWTDED